MINPSIHTNTLFLVKTYSIALVVNLISVSKIKLGHSKNHMPIKKRKKKVTVSAKRLGVI